MHLHAGACGFCGGFVVSVIAFIFSILTVSDNSVSCVYLVEESRGSLSMNIIHSLSCPPLFLLLSTSHISSCPLPSICVDYYCLHAATRLKILSFSMMPTDHSPSTSITLSLNPMYVLVSKKGRIYLLMAEI